MAARPPNLAKERTLVQQEASLRRRYPGGQVVRAAGSLTWLGKLKPTESSSPYEVLIDHRPPRPPLVYVVRPRLEVRAGERLPHVYPLNTLCLYLGEEWSRAHWLTDLVGWASEWLFFYEVWLATGTWMGGGLHSEDVVMNRATRRSLARGRSNGTEGEIAAKRERLADALQKAYGRTAASDELLYNSAV
jgi:hypothetical protein